VGQWGGRPIVPERSSKGQLGQGVNLATGKKREWALSVALYRCVLRGDLLPTIFKLRCREYGLHVNAIARGKKRNAAYPGKTGEPIVNATAKGKEKGGSNGGIKVRENSGSRG